jgi:hypothetical protein
MPYLPVELKVDLTNTHTAIVMVLRDKRAKDMSLLNQKQVGDILSDQDGNLVPMTVAIRAEIAAEIAEADRLIAELS